MARFARTSIIASSSRVGLSRLLSVSCPLLFVLNFVSGVILWYLFVNSDEDGAKDVVDGVDAESDVEGHNSGKTTLAPCNTSRREASWLSSYEGGGGLLSTLARVSFLAPARRRKRNIIPIFLYDSILGIMQYRKRVRGEPH
ncbi:hypothetical protein RRF57_007387 [Xylaria bambusicola]|uniref:Uncharacterized protein n=1 Tax=Xylaria bambusicola TaxID=326684 RepID=A0AAN7ZAI4_9PEZI